MRQSTAQHTPARFRSDIESTRPETHRTSPAAADDVHVPAVDALVGILTADGEGSPIILWIDVLVRPLLVGQERRLRRDRSEHDVRPKAVNEALGRAVEKSRLGRGGRPKWGRGKDGQWCTRRDIREESGPARSKDSGRW
jgi:hypothetical protein